MRKKGSITVFLSLILVLLFSFVLTTLEGARIRGATAYVAMLSELSGDSFLASYYYPLFKEYRLFGVDAGNERGYLAENEMTENLKENISFGLEQINGGLLSFQPSGVVLEDYETLMTGEGQEFLSQVRRQTVLEGLSLTLTELFSKEMFTEAGAVGNVYRKQEEALAATATVTRELMKLMELVDGICMDDNGIALDKNGRLQAESAFIKQLVPMELSELREAYENEEIYRTISESFYRSDEAAAEIKQSVKRVMELKADIDFYKSSITNYKSEKASLIAVRNEEKKRIAAEEDADTSYLEQLNSEIAEVNSALERVTRKKSALENEKENLISGAKKQYKELKGKLGTVEDLLEDGLQILDTLEKKQKTAAVSVAAYEVFLEGSESVLSEELYQVFLQELDAMKAYAGMEGKGYSVSEMRKTMRVDLDLLQNLSLKGFSEQNLSGVMVEMDSVIREIEAYSVESLWFSYGEIVVAKQTKENVMGALAELLTTGVLSLVGISEEEQSDRKLSGEALPSAGLEKETVLEELFACMEKVATLFQVGDIGSVLVDAGNAALDTTALELYCIKYFHSFGEKSPYTRLNYEREYLIFGKEEDKANLLYMVLHLVAIRALLSMVSLLKQPEKTAQLETLATGVAGFTGISVLAAVVKYSLLLLWSVEEALVEVAALLQGKRIPVIGNGTVSFSELFLMNKARIAGKASRLPDSIGAAYEDYLILLSLTRATKVRTYRAMDLIQENIRYRYNDSFRMRNMVTGITFCVQAKLEQLFDTGWFPAGAYELEWTERSAYQ